VFTPGGINLKGETRYVVDDRVFAVAESGFGDGIYELSLERRTPEGPVSQADADAIARVAGIALVSEDGERALLSGTRLRPADGERGYGYVVLVFEVPDEAFFSQPWLLEWPGHDPFQANTP
jgi:hypothetical protein